MNEFSMFIHISFFVVIILLHVYTLNKHVKEKDEKIKELEQLIVKLIK